MNDFLQRLRQRKLVQWALAYIAFAFALLQGVDLVRQKFGWPDLVGRVLIIAACVGFFLMVVLAWYHGEQGRQRVSGTELLIFALLLAIAVTNCGCGAPFDLAATPNFSARLAQSGLPWPPSVAIKYPPLSASEKP